MGLASSYSNFPTLRMDIRICDWSVCLFKARGGGVLPYVSHNGYVLPQRVRFLRRSGLKTGMVFEETTEVYERIYSK